MIFLRTTTKLTLSALLAAGLFLVDTGRLGAAGVDQPLFRALEWRSIGPYRGGRVTTVAGIAGQPQTYYFGATGGGVWKTDDGGLNWRPVSDRYFKTGSVGAIAVSESDPNVIYAGMGEVCIRSNFSHGDGVYKSTDGGESWQNMGLQATRQIGQVRIDPENPDVVYVAALGHVFGANEERGVFRSRDGGKSWQKVLYVDDKTGAVDLVIDPFNPRRLFAAFWQVRRTPWLLDSGGPGSGLYRSTDGGDNWTELKVGLPEGIKGRIGVTASPVRRDRLWAIVEAEDGGVFRSDDGGESWVRTNNENNIRERPWYYSHIYADTQDADTVYVLTLLIEKSVDGGKTFQSIRPPHSDNHDLWFDPHNSQRLINANDGGVNVSTNGGKTWTTQNNQPTAQFYHVTTDQQFPYRIYGAQQDNSTVSIASRSADAGISAEDWYAVGGGESGHIAPDPRNPDIVFAGSYYGLLTRYDRSAGQTRNISIWPMTPGGRPAADVKYRFQWTFPILFSPHTPHHLYAAANVLFESSDEGQSWQVISPDLTRNDKSTQGPTGGPLTGDNSSADYYGTIFAVEFSPLKQGLIWTGSDDGLIHLTMDGGGNWKNVTPADLPKWSRVNEIEASPHDPATAYVAVNRYQSADFKPYIYKTSDYGQTWQLRVAGIPEEAFVRVVVEDPEKQGLLYAGTETGVYVSFDDGSSWQPLQLNLPVVPITDLTLQGGDLIAATQGRAFWVLDHASLLRKITPGSETSENLFQPDDYMLLGGGGRGFPSGNEGDNPPAGPAIYYSLSQEAFGPVTLEFMDGEGQLIKSYQSSNRKPASSQQSGFGAASGDRTVSAKAGMNRFVWDMRYPDAAAVPGKSILFGGSVRGPEAPPGTYQVRLTVDKQVQMQTFSIRQDPRLPSTPEDLRSQFELQMKIRDQLSRTHRAVAEIFQMEEDVKNVLIRAQSVRLKERIEPAARELTEALAEVREELIQTRITSGNDVLSYAVRLNNQLAALGRVVASTDVAPTRQSYEVYDVLSAELQTQLDRLEKIKKEKVEAFNRLVDKEKIPAVVTR